MPVKAALVLTLLLFSPLHSAAAPVNATSCKAPPVIAQHGLEVRPGYSAFLPAEVLRPLQEALPRVATAEVDAALRSPDTMWYDEDSMVFLYQDSIETVTGARANCVGRMVGERNQNNPQIGKLLKYFGPDYRFLFPFRTAAGTDRVDNIRVLNFWSPPRRDGRVMPVKWWKLSSRGRWRWTFPVATLFGEVLYQRSPDGQWYVFEIRTRKRYRDGWAVDVFRPFRTAEDLAREVVIRRPHWESSPTLSRFVQVLRSRDNLVAHGLVSQAYGKIFPAIDGALDPLPDPGDPKLVGELLRTVTFVSCEGAIWKENGKLETYAPASEAAFSVVPKGYEMGIIPVNEVSCRRCHDQTGRRLGDLEFDIILYGEVWGEDQIFTWHLFEPHRYAYDTWDDADNSRKINPRLVEAGLLKNEKPSAMDPDYKPLPTVFKPDARRAFYPEAIR